MKKNFAFVLLILCAPFVKSASPPDDPLIFFLEADGGSKNCLIALNHLTLVPAIESAEIVGCEKRARALVMEANPNLTSSNFWSNYERGADDPAISDLNESTVKKIVTALKAAQYNNEEISYFLTLHPIAIYRALIYSKPLSPNFRMRANIDIQIANVANQKKFKIIEMEGMPSYFRSERRLSINQINDLVSKMCDLLLHKEKIATYSVKANAYAQNLSSQPDIDTAWNKKLWFNTVALGLPNYTMSHDVDDRNETLVSGMLKAIKAEEPVLIFIGSAHIGGPNGVLKQLEKKGVKITRIR